MIVKIPRAPQLQMQAGLYSKGLYVRSTRMVNSSMHGLHYLFCFLPFLAFSCASGMRNSRLWSLHSLQNGGGGGRNLMLLMVIDIRFADGG